MRGIFPWAIDFCKFFTHQGFQLVVAKHTKVRESGLTIFCMRSRVVAMENKSVRASIRSLANDAKELLEDVLEGADAEELDENFEIVERLEQEIVAYIEALERENATLKERAA